jgi:hypothetical protein
MDEAPNEPDTSRRNPLGITEPFTFNDLERIEAALESGELEPEAIEYYTQILAQALKPVTKSAQEAQGLVAKEIAGISSIFRSGVLANWDRQSAALAEAASKQASMIPKDLFKDVSASFPQAQFPEPETLDLTMIRSTESYMLEAQHDTNDVLKDLLIVGQAQEQKLDVIISSGDIAGAKQARQNTIMIWLAAGALLAGIGSIIVTLLTARTYGDAGMLSWRF